MKGLFSIFRILKKNSLSFPLIFLSFGLLLLNFACSSSKVAKISGQVINPEELKGTKKVAVFSGITGKKGLDSKAVDLADLFQNQLVYEAQGKIEFVDRKLVKEKFPKGVLEIESPWKFKSIPLTGAGMWKHDYKNCDEVIVKEVRETLNVDAFFVFWLCEEFTLTQKKGSPGWIGAQLFSAKDGSEIWHGGTQLGFGNGNIPWLAKSVFVEETKKADIKK